MTTISKTGLNLIKQFEGYVPEVYRCPAGVLTCGWGTTGHGIEKMAVGEAVPIEQSEEWLAEDVAKFAEAVDDLVKVPITQNQADALISFCYNCGVVAFQTSTLLRLLNAGDYVGAAGQFSRWVTAAGKKLPGLVKRRAAEQELFLTT